MRTLVLSGGLALIAAAGGFMFVGCAMSASTCADDGTCAPTASLLDGGSDGNIGDGATGGDVVAPGVDAATDAGDAAVDGSDGCDLTADPKEAPLCVTSAYGVFVDVGHGDDSAAGTPQAPFRTIGHALMALGGTSRVYVCEGTYNEPIALTSAVSIYGGFSCATWTYSGTKAVITPAATTAITVTGTADEVVLSDLDVTAANGVAAGESSIGLFASNASKVTLRRMNVTGGTGANGSTGTSPADFTTAAGPAGSPGGSEDVTSNGLATSNPACPTSVGGAGGNSTNNLMDNGVAGVVATSAVFPSGFSGAGGTAGGTCTSGSGTPGSYGGVQAQAAGAPSTGSLSASGWSPASGSDGGKGVDGQGGGGGAKLVNRATGASGGAGGCGGAGGGKGGGGGASIAVAAFDSQIVVEASTNLGAMKAGDGGSGGQGQMAQTGGLGGTVLDHSTACDGGNGGAGGSGGGGGGGAGGVSVGILYAGTPPFVGGANVTDAMTAGNIAVGAAGTQGVGGAGGEPARTAAPASSGGAKGDDGVPGVAKAVMASP